MAVPCTKCSLITAARRAVLLAKIEDKEILEKAIQDYLLNLMTFREMCTKLDLTEQEILSIIPKEFWDRRFEDGE